MPVRRKAHHCQLLATPFSRTRLVTRFGVSVLKVVATMDTPTSHQGAERPEVKNSAVLLPARRARTTAGMKDTTILAMTMSQSRGTRRMRSPRKEARRHRGKGSNDQSNAGIGCAFPGGSPAGDSLPSGP